MQAKLNPALGDLLSRVPVVPVLTIEDVHLAIPLARALVAGGLNVLEVTLRTDASLEALSEIANHVPDAIVGAGTVLSPMQGNEAISAGARFLVSPGMTPALLQAASEWRRPYLPGAATASEAMALMDLGYRVLKFFPAGQIGGAPALRALGAPLGHVVFCPTGGIGPANVRDYLALPNVVCVGGSWVAPPAAIANGDWKAITALAHEAAQLRRSAQS